MITKNRKPSTKWSKNERDLLESSNFSGKGMAETSYIRRGLLLTISKIYRNDLGLGEIRFQVSYITLKDRVEEKDFVAKHETETLGEALFIAGKLSDQAALSAGVFA